MKEVLNFPKLGLTFHLSKIACLIGPFKIYWYGVLITIGFILGFCYISLMAKRFYLKMDDVISMRDFLYLTKDEPDNSQIKLLMAKYKLI